MAAPPRLGRADQARQTRLRILSIAGELFAEQTYAGTTVAQIAAELGATKAAVYHHFSSKEEILAEIVAAPAAAFNDLADRAAGKPPAEVNELLEGLVDLFARFPAVSVLLERDPSALSAVTARFGSGPAQDSVVAALAGPSSLLAEMRAQAALAAIRAATATALTQYSEITPDLRAEIILLGKQLLTRD